MLLPQKLEVFWAAGPFTPRKEHVVTHHELWYRYVPESGNWHDGTFTRKIEAFSAATSTRGFGTSNNAGSSGIQSTLLAAQFRGANAEWTEAEMRAVMNVLLPVGRTVPW